VGAFDSVTNPHYISLPVLLIVKAHSFPTSNQTVEFVTFH